MRPYNNLKTRHSIFDLCVIKKHLLLHLLKKAMPIPLKLFIDHASQPSRAIIVFCKINRIPHEIVELRLAKGQVITIMSHSI